MYIPDNCTFDGVYIRDERGEIVINNITGNPLGTDTETLQPVFGYTSPTCGYTSPIAT
jgi:hypothetical protein